ncbi:MAG: class I SAM-dependent methyltransferase [Candidatus Aminicenantes bacterium]|nr:MAG: class I SAM-dependent methyltransferase [Candidatus Aminicenantes bacterium]
MKQLVKKVLTKLKLLDKVILIYGNLGSIRYMNLSHEMKYRLKGAPDGYALPPSSLIYQVIGHGWRSIFYDSGDLIVKHMLEHLKRNQIEFKNFSSILDFGCGCGRLLRHIKSQGSAQLQGSDYNRKLIQWCQENLKFADFNVNHLAPPIQYHDEEFDLIYAQSVFTHLSKELQLQWLRELHRILRPKGILYFTTHGEQFFQMLTDQQKQTLKKENIFVLNIESQGKNWCTSFHLPLFFKQKLKKGFEMIDFIPGKDQIHLQQDVNIFKKNHHLFEFYNSQ